MERMEESGAGAEGEPELKESQQMEGTEEHETEDPERGRPSTPKWWRPPIPPETYKWEEMRRQRQKGGYPWTHLDKDEDIDFDDYLDDNLYEPVNPPPLYGNESYLSKDLQQVPQQDEPMIEIPPELDILSSEGLDGLDKPDPHDRGFDGEREWQNAPSEDEGHHSKAVVTESCLKPREARPTTPKSVGFSPETITHQVSDDLEEQEVPDQEGEEEIDETERPSSRASSGHSGHSGGHGKRQTPFDILKAKAANAAGHVKERIRKAIPVRSKISAEALKKSRRRKKVKHGQEEEEEEAEQEVGAEAEKMEEGESPQQAEQPGPSETTAEMEQGVPEVEKVEDKDVEEVDEKAAKLAAKQQEDEELKRKKEEEKLQKQKEKEEQERIKAEEKLAKQKAAEEAKKAKEEEKARIAEEKRQAKEEEEKRKQLEKEEAARIAAEKKKEEEARKAAEKAKKEEEARIAAEKKKEEEARKAAEKAKKEEEARIAAEVKKAEEEAKKVAEKARKEEEAKLAAEKKAEEKARKEEEARLVAEKKAEEKAKKEEEAEDVEQVEEQVEEKFEEKVEQLTEMAADEMEAETGVANEEAQDEEMEVAPPQTPSGTTKRKYIRHRRQLPEIPNPITMLRNQVEDFKNKLKRSRTPPRRIVRKHRRSRSADASKSPPRDLEDEPVEDEAEEKKEDAEEDSTEKSGPPEPASESKPATEVKTEASIEATEIVTESAQTSSSAPDPEAEPSIGGSEEPTEAPSTGTRGRTRTKRQPAAEKLDKIGQTIKGIGAKSLGIASQAGKVVGQNMKVVGKDLQKLGSKAMGEIKAKQEAAKNRKASQGTVEMYDETSSLPETTEVSIEPPKRGFKLRRRNESQERADEEEMEREDQQHFYENAALGHDQPREENRLLGSGAKDWESPHDRAHSSDVSEEPYSGNASARDSPPGSSLASSNFAQGRRTGVLEEIDSDEFFLRERGISEGEDADEVNRFLVEELRQAFRPTMASNALAGFDMDDRVVPQPPRPDRAPKKPPRKDKEEETSPTMYQTFPPERPKRKQPQGYVSKFMKEHDDEYDDMDSNEEVRGSSDEMRESESVEGDEGIQMLKTKLSKIESEEEETQIETTIAPAEPQELEPLEEYEDDGRYEPISEGPVKPTRTKRSKPKRPPTPPSFYYNTIAANEWLQELENTESADPAAPIRKRRGSGKSTSVPRSEEGIVVDSIQQLEEQIIVSPSQPDVHTTAQTEHTEASIGVAGALVDDYIDEAGYAIVQKDREVPTTIPRKKKKRAKELQSAAEQADPNRAFFSMPRAAPRNIDAAPPARPNRTYSTLRPRRPPRSKSGSRSPASIRREGEESRPSNIISLMQGRPLPPPPRPGRSPALEHRIVLDQNSIEQSVGLRHYANFDDIEPHSLEEVLTTPPPPRVSEVDIACQTDPVPEDEFIVGSLSLTAESLMEDGSRIITASSRLERSETRPEGRSSTPTTAGDVSSSFQTSRSPPPRPPHTQSSQTQPQTEPLPPTQNPPFVFPTRLHLHELEVDFIKVNELCAQTIKVGQLQTSQLEANSINATGPVCAPEIRTQSLHSEEVNCNKLSSDTVDSPSIPPLSFYQLSSPDQLKPGSEQELCLKAEEKEEKENDSACPLEYHDSMQSLLGNVDSTNDMKSSHVAEKVLDKQLNVEQSTPASNQTKTRKDASVGTPSALSRNVPAQLNNLNQESSSITQSITSEQLQHQSIVENIAAPPQEESGNHHIETEESSNEPPVEEAVVRGSYTLPYSYLPSQPTPTPMTRERSSLKRSQRSKRSQSPGEETPRVAFGHTSVAQGEVLSVKLSIPVERGALPQAGAVTPPTTAPPRLHRTISPTTETPSDSPVSAAESAKKNVQKAAESEGTKPSSPVPRRASQSTPQQPPPCPPPPAPPQVQGDVDVPDSNENLLRSSIRLGRAVLRFTMRSLQAMADYIDTASSDDPGKAEQQRANMQVLLCLLLVLVVGLILATTRSGPYITPRWEFLMPPPDL